MKCLIVGTDKLGTAPKILNKRFGVREVLHWDGRRRKPPPNLPKGTDIVVVYTGFICHGLMLRVRDLAKKSDVRVIYVKRGLSELMQYTNTN